MRTCENCWRDAALLATLNGVPQVDEYRRLLDERSHDPPAECVAVQRAWEEMEARDEGR